MLRPDFFVGQNFLISAAQSCEKSLLLFTNPFDIECVNAPLHCSGSEFIAFVRHAFRSEREEKRSRGHIFSRSSLQLVLASA